MTQTIATAARTRAGLLCIRAYAVALAVAVVVGALAPVDGLAWRTFWADVAATVAIFGFSLAYRSSSFYDAYWSVAPMAIALVWLAAGFGDANAARALLVVAGVLVWGARLTFNWWRGWTGLDHEDWRYVDLRAKTGSFYWIVSFLGIHMMPTGMVFLGCLPLVPALVTSDAPFGVVDAIAALALAAAIWCEAEADNQLARFKGSRPPAGATLATGLWAWSRHPNYFGEMLFWWALAGFGYAAAPDEWWRVVGALAITVMFRVISLPMIDARMLERRADYAALVATVPSVVPRPPRRRA